MTYRVIWHLGQADNNSREDVRRRWLGIWLCLLISAVCDVIAVGMLKYPQHERMGSETNNTFFQSQGRHYSVKREILPP
jgi:hypothetical protein